MNGEAVLNDEQQERRGAEGAARAWSATDPEWQDIAMNLILSRADSGEVFTPDDITLDPTLPEVSEPRAVGMAFLEASRERLIEKVYMLDIIGPDVVLPETIREQLEGQPLTVVSRNPKQHGNRIQVWRKKQ